MTKVGQQVPQLRPERIRAVLLLFRCHPAGDDVVAVDLVERDRNVPGHSVLPPGPEDVYAGGINAIVGLRQYQLNIVSRVEFDCNE